jgi:hypothetical protein
MSRGLIGASKTSDLMTDLPFACSVGTAGCLSLTGAPKSTISPSSLGSLSAVYSGCGKKENCVGLKYLGSDGDLGRVAACIPAVYPFGVDAGGIVSTCCTHVGTSTSAGTSPPYCDTGVGSPSSPSVLVPDLSCIIIYL